MPCRARHESSVRAARIALGPIIATAPAPRAPVKSPMCARRSSATRGAVAEFVQPHSTGPADRAPRRGGAALHRGARAADTGPGDRGPRRSARVSLLSNDEETSMTGPNVDRRQFLQSATLAATAVTAATGALAADTLSAGDKA